MINKTSFLIVLLLAVAIGDPTFAQNLDKSGLFGGRRQRVDMSNYYIKLNTQDALMSICGIIEWKVDSLINQEPNPPVRNALVELKYHLTLVLANTALHSDPLVGALDTWALLHQLVNYFSEEDSYGLYNNYNVEIARTLQQFLEGYEQWLSSYVSDQVRQQLIMFSDRFPIQDERFNRRSVVPMLSAWISEAELRLKSSLLTMADLMRDISFRMNFYAEMVPKQTLWQVEGTVAGLMPKDTLSMLVTSVNEMMKTSRQLMEDVEELIGFNRDTILSNLSYQRIESFKTIREERIAAFESIALEREVLLETFQQERLAIEKFVTQERIVALDEVNRMSRELMAGTVPLGKELIDYIFFRAVIALTVLGCFVLAAILLFRRRGSSV